MRVLGFVKTSSIFNQQKKCGRCSLSLEPDHLSNNSDHVMSRPRRGVAPQKYMIEDSDNEEQDFKEENESNASSEELSPFEGSDVSRHISIVSVTHDDESL
jgi:hypothetical protein